MKYDKMLMLLTLVAAGLAAGCSDDEDPLKDWTGPSKPGTEIKTPAEVGNRVVAHRGGSTEAGTRQFPDNSVAALNYAIGLLRVGVRYLPYEGRRCRGGARIGGVLHQ